MMTAALDLRIAEPSMPSTFLRRVAAVVLFSLEVTVAYHFVRKAWSGSRKATALDEDRERQANDPLVQTDELPQPNSHRTLFQF